jgi:hypothetical protein
MGLDPDVASKEGKSLETSMSSWPPPPTKGFPEGKAPNPSHHDHA